MVNIYKCNCIIRAYERLVYGGAHFVRVSVEKKLCPPPLKKPFLKNFILTNVIRSCTHNYILQC